MRPGAIALAVVSLLLLSAEASAVDTYSTSQFRKTIAQATVPDRNSEQLYFSVVAGTFWSPEIHKLALSDGIYYQFSGMMFVSRSMERLKTLEPGDGIFHPGRRSVLSRSNQFGPAPDLPPISALANPRRKPAWGHRWTDSRNLSITRRGSRTDARAKSSESHESPYTKPQSPPDPMHRRTGAALHYVLSGVGAEFGEGNAAARGPGSVSYEPAGFTYQWSNPGAQPLIYLVFNVNPKDIEPVIVQDQQPQDPFERDPHLTLAIYCVGISMFLTLMVTSGTIAAHHREKRARLDRDDDPC